MESLGARAREGDTSYEHIVDNGSMATRLDEVGN
jgi:hypothetical protein